MKLAEVVGAGASQNPSYLGTAALAAAVTAIAFPSSKRDLETIAQRLDDEGIADAILDRLVPQCLAARP